MVKKVGSEFQCAYCGRGLDELGGGAYAPSLKSVYCPRGLGTHCVERDIFKRQHTEMVFGEDKTIEELRKIRKQGGLSG